MAKNDDKNLRKLWVVGSLLEVFSSSSNQWIRGTVDRIFYDDEGEWLDIKYTANNKFRIKQVPRFDESSIRPYNPPPLPPKEKMVPSQQSNENNNEIGSDDDDDLDLKKKNVPDEEVRKLWKAGSKVEVFSRSAHCWFSGEIDCVFYDHEGEWLKVIYSRDRVKEIPRDSLDIRAPVRRYKCLIKMEKKHIAKVSTIWEDVDLDGSRHLDSIGFCTVLKSLNLELSSDTMEEIFNWIDELANDGDRKDAITADEFVQWLQTSTKTKKQRDIQIEIFKHIDDIVSGKTEMNEDLQKDVEQLKQIYSPHALENSHQENPESQQKIIFTRRDSFVSNMDDIRKQLQEELRKKSEDEEKNEDEKDEKGNKDDKEELVEMEDDHGDFSDDLDEKYDEFETNKYDQKHDEASGIEKKSEPYRSSFDPGYTLAVLKSVGFLQDFLVASIEDQVEQYEAKSQRSKLKNAKEGELAELLKEVQKFMHEKCDKAGMDGLRMNELACAVAHRFKNFNRKNYMGRNSRFADFAALCPNIVVVEMDNYDNNMDRICVTSETALRINLKQKLQFVLAMTFDKSKLDNNFKLVSQDIYGRRRRSAKNARNQRRLSVGERLLTVQDFGERWKSLGIPLANDCQRDELFWSVSGSNTTMISQNMVGKFFASLIDDLDGPVNPSIVHNLPLVVERARLRYRRDPIWSKYIIQRTHLRWNNISYLYVTDRRTRTKNLGMIVIPKKYSPSVNSFVQDDQEAAYQIQKSFHNMCHILNTIQFPTVVSKIEHGQNPSNFMIILKRPEIQSFGDLLHMIKNEKICYSEKFIAQLVGVVVETIAFCHKHNVVNFNLNLNDIGFDSNLRPILNDFTRSFYLEPDDVIQNFMSVTSSTAPELALSMSASGHQSSDIKLTGRVLRRADTWRVGVLLYTLVTGTHPYPDATLTNFVTNILTMPPVVPIEDIPDISAGLRKLLGKLLEKTYFNRMNIEDCLKDEWFKKASDTPLSQDLFDRMMELSGVDICRNWISTVSHVTLSQPPFLPDQNKIKKMEKEMYDRDKKYFARLDVTGQRKRLKRTQLILFLEDCLGYCHHQAVARVDQIEKNLNVDLNDQGLKWKEFEIYYEQFKLNSPENLLGQNTKKSKKHKYLSNYLTNAIFKGLSDYLADKDVSGEEVKSCHVMSLFEDINLKLQPVIDMLQKATVTFEQVQQSLYKALEDNFDITELLSIDNMMMKYCKIEPANS